ncbi:hypothetical protein NDU88_000544 [Pleurodeles waltl]|uniref:Uncharacterized protein n=1 Tax=Pleurodeles waltl TaxID=8319 RepID=A0AAV7KN33_PLEWA|nr:hypothetical protein NDU88_000544 [Pleurodeles waltl]
MAEDGGGVLVQREAHRTQWANKGLGGSNPKLNYPWLMDLLCTFWVPAAMLKLLMSAQWVAHLTLRVLGGLPEVSLLGQVERFQISHLWRMYPPMLNIHRALRSKIKRAEDLLMALERAVILDPEQAGVLSEAT